MTLLEMELRRLNDELEGRFAEYLLLKPDDTFKRIEKEAELTAWAERLKKIKWELKNAPNLRNSQSLRRETERLNRLIRELLKNNSVALGEILNNYDDARQLAVDELEAIHTLANRFRSTSIEAPQPPPLPHMTVDAYGYLFPTLVFGVLVFQKLHDRWYGKKR